MTTKHSINTTKGNTMKTTSKTKTTPKPMMIEMYHIHSELLCEGTYQSFVKNNAEDEEVIEALTKLKNGATEVRVAVGQGYNLLKVKK